MVAGSVGIRFERTRAAHQSTHQALSAAPFLIQQLARLPKGHISTSPLDADGMPLYLLAQGGWRPSIETPTPFPWKPLRAHSVSPVSTTRVLNLEASADHPAQLGPRML